MTAFALVDATILAGGTDLTGQSNEVSLEPTADSLDATVFGSGGWRARQAGLRGGTFGVKGFYAAGDLSLPDDALFASLGVRGVPLTLSPVLPVVGGVAYLLKTMSGSYSWGGQVGELCPFTGGAEADGPIVRGAYAMTGTKTVTTNGAAVNLGAVPAGSKLYAALHVVTVSGVTPSLTVSIQSDDAVGLPSPTTRGSFAAATARGSQWLEIASPGAGETFWRATATISGTTPSFLFHVSFGIGPA